jgi:drug/metabolite transporter (DMT)-like permease
MSAEESVVHAAAPAPMQWLDLAAIGVCTLAWGTTWFAITQQLGVVDPVVSVAYRFSLASALLFAWCVLRKQTVRLTRQQHGAALGLGFCTFAINYAFVYWAEESVTSAVVAVLFAAMAFVNLGVFRVAFGQRSPALAWGAAGLGVLGVGVLSWSEIAAAHMSAQAQLGIALGIVGVFMSCAGNVFARRAELAGAPVATLTAWSMGYGALILALFALATGRRWAFAMTWPYVLSLLHLAINGSVVAFLLYFGLARRRGYVTASYISALTPPVAMTVSSFLEARHWGPAALLGVAFVLSGQLLLLRTRKA